MLRVDAQHGIVAAHCVLELGALPVQVAHVEESLQRRWGALYEALLTGEQLKVLKVLVWQGAGCPSHAGPAGQAGGTMPLSCPSRHSGSPPDRCWICTRPRTGPAGNALLVVWPAKVEQPASLQSWLAGTQSWHALG